MAYLFLTTLILSIISYYVNNRELVAPSFLFSISFMLASFFAMLNSDNWGKNINPATYWVITLGIGEFIFICYFLRLLFREDCNSTLNYESTIFNIKFGKNKLITLEVVQLIFIVIIIRSIIKVTGQTNIAQAINTLNFSANNELNSTVALPSYAKVMQTFNFEVGILGIYLFIKNIIYNKKFDLTLFIEALIGALGSLLNGSRGGTLMCIVASVVFILILKQGKYRFYKKSNSKNIIYTFLIIFIVLLLLKWSATVVGRDVQSYNIFDYISLYIGAEIKNLDIFINNGLFPAKNQLFGQQTFTTIYSFLIKHANLGIQPYFLDLPYQVINGHLLGNVYTTFYPWIYDFGYTGVAVLTFLMAFISETMYFYSKKASKNFAPLFKLFYGGTVAPCILFSFFSNRFYEAMNIVNTLVTIIIWASLNYLFKNNMQNIEKEGTIK